MSSIGDDLRLVIIIISISIKHVSTWKMRSKGTPHPHPRAVVTGIIRHQMAVIKYIKCIKYSTASTSNTQSTWGYLAKVSHLLLREMLRQHIHLISNKSSASHTVDPRHQTHRVYGNTRRTSSTFSSMRCSVSTSISFQTNQMHHM